jgi:hypothetical protein
LASEAGLIPENFAGSLISQSGGITVLSLFKKNLIVILNIFFKLQQKSFCIQSSSARIAGQVSCFGYNSVARDNDWNGIFTACSANRAGG